MPYKDPEKRKEYIREWYLKNKDKQAKNCKRWEEANKQYRQEQHKEWSKTEKGRKSLIIANWKQLGIIHDDFDTIYDIYINTKECDVCKVELTEGRGKNCRNLDHDHETGEIRGILCWECNITDVLAKPILI